MASANANGLDSTSIVIAWAVRPWDSMPPSKFHTLFSDIGGVLATNGWDTALRQRVATHFGVQLAEIEGRHQLTFDSYERGFMTFEHYLQRVFFASPRDFKLEDVRDYVYSQSVAWPENISFFHRVKLASHVKFGLISNEGEGITEHRLRKFGLREVADFMVISHFVHFRKPDPEIWKLALNLANARPEESIYIDDREMFADVASGLGFTAIHHTSLETTSTRLRELGLAVE